MSSIRTSCEPLFSVCIPVHDERAWLGGAIESVLAQTWQSFELVVSDNASTEDLRGLVEGFDDPRIRYHRFDPLVGVVSSFNRACSLGSGTWVHPLSADDRLHATCLERIATVIEAEDGRRAGPIVLVAGSARRVDVRGRRTEVGALDPKQRRPFPYGAIEGGVHDASSWLLANARAGGSSWMIGGVSFRRQTLVEAGGFRPEMEMCADLELVLRLAAHGPVAYIDEPVVDYTVRPDSVSQLLIGQDLVRQTTTTMRNRAWLSGMEAHLTVREVSKDECRAMRGTMARSLLQRAVSQRINPAGGGTIAAWRDVARALRVHPGTVLRSRGLGVAAGVSLLPVPFLRSLRTLGHRFGIVVS